MAARIGNFQHQLTTHCICHPAKQKNTIRMHCIIYSMKGLKKASGSHLTSDVRRRI